MHPLETRQPATSATPLPAVTSASASASAAAAVAAASGSALDAIPPQRPWPEPEPAEPSLSAAGATAGPGPEPGAGAGTRGGLARVRGRLPSPASYPFAFGYAVLLLVTSLYSEYGDPHTVSALLRGSSTDVAHLSTAPVLAIFASALWIAGGIASPYAMVFIFVLATLERRIGGWRTAGVFLLGHVVATLATELPVAVSVLAGHLPASSLHRLDYGISFGLMATVGALAGLLAPLLRWAALAVVGALLVQDLLEMVEPLAAWGHPVALLAGIACWPAVRRVRLTPKG
ncbi:rhomboid-like protein [Streptomyces sp. NPDC057910]|uniref:rhomboid-like protein n=1 Tax=Streptomyces sp. NPDC057910 TaxID=3346278 RepID=UPI0036E42269